MPLIQTHLHKRWPRTCTHIHTIIRSRVALIQRRIVIKLQMKGTTLWQISKKMRNEPNRTAAPIYVYEQVVNKQTAKKYTAHND